MRTRLISRIGLAFAVALGAGAFAGIVAVHAASPGNAAVNLKKDSNGLFLLTITDPEGIREFSLKPPSRPRYAGAVADCPRTFQSTNVLFTDPLDFDPVMTATITDCRGNAHDLEIPPPVDGLTRSRRLAVAEEEAPAAPKAAPREVDVPVSSGAAGPERTGGGEVSEGERRAALTEIEYPVRELGGCENEVACRAYCDDLDNVRVCIDFAEKNGLIGAADAELGRRFADAGGSGPGGCTGKDSCTAYCEETSHINECLEFGERTGFLEGRELEEAKIAARLLREGAAFPGGCTSKSSCEAYCSESGHEDECLAFAERSGFLPPEELAQAKKMLPIIKQGGAPGGCRSKAACEAYCQTPANMRSCIAFAEENGLISPEELEMAKKVIPLFESGQAPGGCTSRESCEAYCGEEGNFEECVSFGERAGLISAADAELARKAGGKGPGGCTSKEQCEAFCQEPENQEACAAFAHELGIEIGGPGGCRNIEECRAYCSSPEHQSECGGFAQERGLNVSGPGGCQGKDQCQAYCTDPAHSSECEKFLGDQGVGFEGPGGCKNFAECESYCRDPAHTAECQAFSGGDTGRERPGGPPPSSGGGGGAFGDCVSKGDAAEYVCAVNGRGAPSGVETTYFNACHARQHGAEILHQGICAGHAPCSDIADPVCGNDNNTWVSACYAENQGGGVQYAGVCRNQPEGAPGSQGGDSFPTESQEYQQQFQQQYGEQYRQQYEQQLQQQSSGACGSPEECRLYCAANPQAPGCSQQIPQSFIAPDSSTVPQEPTNVAPQDGTLPSDVLQSVCPSFASVPSCDVVGPAGSENYNYCAQCFPEKAGSPGAVPPSSVGPGTSPLGLILAPFIPLFR